MGNDKAKALGNQLAHPVEISRYDAGLNDWIDVQTRDGLTKREMFAAMAMQGILSNPAEYQGCQPPEAYVKIAIGQADALLEALAAEPTP